MSALCNYLSTNIKRPMITKQFNNIYKTSISLHQFNQIIPVGRPATSTSGNRVYEAGSNH